MKDPERMTREELIAEVRRLRGPREFSIDDARPRGRPSTLHDERHPRAEPSRFTPAPGWVAVHDITNQTYRNERTR
jgi:hypothetical protein